MIYGKIMPAMDLFLIWETLICNQKKQQCSINPSASQVSWRLNIGFGEQSGEPPVKKKDQKIDVYVHGAGHVLTPAKKSTFPDGLKRIILNPTITRVLFR
jgi:hypothetical protein